MSDDTAQRVPGDEHEAVLVSFSGCRFDGFPGRERRLRYGWGWGSFLGGDSLSGRGEQNLLRVQILSQEKLLLHRPAAGRSEDRL